MVYHHVTCKFKCRHKIDVREIKGSSETTDQAKASSSKSTKQKQKYSASKSCKVKSLSTATMSTKSSTTRTTSTGSSSKSAKAKLAALEATRKANAEISQLERQQAKLRWKDEEEQLKRRYLRETKERDLNRKQEAEKERKRQREKEEKERKRQLEKEEKERKRQREEEEKKLQFRREEKELRIQRIREERERRFQQQLEETRPRAEFNEALAELSVDNDVAKADFLPSDFPNYDRTVSTNIGLTKCKPAVGDWNVVSESSKQGMPADNGTVLVQENVGLYVSTSSVTHARDTVSTMPPRVMFSNECGVKNDRNFTFCNATKKPFVMQSDRTYPKAQQRNFLPSEVAATQPHPNITTECAPDDARFISDHLMPFQSFGHSQYADLPIYDQTTWSDRKIYVQSTPNLSLDPPIFDGNPANYCGFVDAFDAIISHIVPEPKRRLFYSLQYTKGPAHALVQGCQYMPPNEGYFIAGKLLKETFGQKFQISKTCIDSITKGPQLHLNNKSALICFSADLNTCTNTLVGLNYLDQIDDLDILTKISKRLPPQWQNSWQIEIDNIIHNKKVMPSIKDLSTYVALKTRQLTNLDCSWSVQGQTKPASNKRRETTLAANTSISDSKQCKLCHDAHYLNQCKQFHKLSYIDRLNFAKNAKLCWSCLESGNFSKECSRLHPCRKPGCTANHTTLLHPPDAPPKQSDEDSTNSPSNPKVKVSNGFVEVPDDRRNLLPIVPVKVYSPNCAKFLVTHAFLDNGSTSFFITNKLISKLNITNSPEVDLTTATLRTTNETRKAKLISNIMITDLCESNHIKLQPLLQLIEFLLIKRTFPVKMTFHNLQNFRTSLYPRRMRKLAYL